VQPLIENAKTEEEKSPEKSPDKNEEKSERKSKRENEEDLEYTICKTFLTLLIISKIDHGNFSFMKCLENLKVMMPPENI